MVEGAGGARTPAAKQYKQGCLIKQGCLRLRAVLLEELEEDEAEGKETGGGWRMLWRGGKPRAASRGRRTEGERCA